MADEQDGINLGTWAARAGEFAVDGWLDPAEPAAVAAAAPLLRGGRVLDIGVGAGRTTPLLRRLGADYVGVDYSPEMVALARQRHPGVDLRCSDARDLATLGDSSIALVFVSNNSLDAVSHEGRAQALAEIARVLRVGGAAVVSTLNKDGRLYRCRPDAIPELPWRSALVPADGYGPQAGVDADDTAAAASWNVARVVGNWRRLSRLAVDHGGWGLAPLPAHEFGLLVHFCTLAAARAELAVHGLLTQRAWGCESPEPLAADIASSASLYLYLLAVKQA